MKSFEALALMTVALIAGFLYYDIKAGLREPLQGQPTKHPIVLAHGLLAGPRSMMFVKQALTPDGHQLFVTTVPTIHNVETRADLLAKQIDQILIDTESEKVNIIAHSMGGLDARYLISKLGYEDKIASLTTVATPHRGTPFADWLLKWTSRISEERLNNLARQTSLRFAPEDIAEMADFRLGFLGISVQTAEQFNQDVPDSDKVYYQSWAGLSNAFGKAHANDVPECTKEGAPFWKPKHIRDTLEWVMIPLAYLTRGPEKLPNDGAVPVSSAKWGNFRGCVPADHLDLLGLYQDKAPNPKTGFDYVRFYRAMAFELAEMGF